VTAGRPKIHRYPPLRLIQGRLSNGTSFIQPLPQGLGLLFPFIPNQPPSRQEKSLELCIPSRLCRKASCGRRAGCSPFQHPKIKSKVENWSKAEVLSGVESIQHRESVFYYPALAHFRHFSSLKLTPHSRWVAASSRRLLSGWGWLAAITLH